MGMDAYIYIAHSKKELESGVLWNGKKLDFEEEDKWKVPREVWYQRKFWDLHNYLEHECFHNEYECGDYVKLEKEDVEKMIKFSTHNSNYWDNFKGVEDLCDILYHWDEIQAAGLYVYYECDW